MSNITTLLRVRSKYVLIAAGFLGLALVLIIAGYAYRGARRSALLGALSDAEQAWLAERSEVRIAGRWEEPPFSYTDEDGMYQGYEVDLAESLGPILGMGIEVVPMPREEALIAIQNGEVDAVMGMVRDAESSEQYGFTEPYMSSSLSIFVRADRFDVAALEDLEGHQVAVQAGTAAETSVAEQTGISAILVPSTEEGLQSVADGQVVALVADEIAGLRAAQETGLAAEIKLVGLPAETVGYAFAVQKDDETAVSVLNRGLAAMEAVGLKQQVDRAWFGAPTGQAEAAATSSTITVALVVVIVALILGNTAYLLSKMRRRADEHTAILYESQDKYRKLVEGTDEAVFTLSGDLSLLEVNNQVESLTGYKKDSLLRMSLEDLVPPGQKEQVRRFVQRAFREGVGTLDDVSLIDRHGDRVPVQLKARPLRQGGRKIVQCIARDVRERERMRHQVLRRSEDLSAINAIASLVSHSAHVEEMLEQVLTKVLDLTRTESGIVYLSAAGDGEMVPVVKRGLTADLMRQVGWPEGSLRQAEEVAESGKVLVTADFSRSAEPVSSDASSAHVGTQAGVPLVSKDRVHGVMNIYGREARRFTDEDIGLLTAVGNRIGIAIENAHLIRQLQRTVSEMGAVRRFSDNVLQGMSNGLVVVDREGKIRLVNLAGERLLGCKEEEVLDSRLEEVLGFGAEIVRDSLERELAYSGEEIVVERERGERIPLGMSISPLRGEGGKVNGAVVMLSDLRETRALEEERRKLDRLAFLGEISAVMAHEIRNPLAGMGAGIQHLQTKFEEGDERHEALGRILREGERVNRIIEDILLISRPPHLNLAPCDISEVIGEVVREWEAKAREKGVEIRQYSASGLPLVKGDKMRLHQALSNLVSNGIEAMPGGGELSITATAPAADGDYIEVEIRDTGVGIKQEDLGRIFEPFWSTKARGTGLGLPITRGIVTEHGGEVEVDSEEGSGTKFVVRLPLARRGGR